MSLRDRAEAIDLAIYRQVRRACVAPDWVRRYSLLGQHGAIWLAAGAAGAIFDSRRRRHWLRAMTSVAAAYSVSTSIKLAVGRGRPDVPELPHLMATPTGLSFPSSHATTSFAAVCAFRGLLPVPVLYGAASVMAISRLSLGVHYPSDIAAGAVLGTILGSVGRGDLSREPGALFTRGARSPQGSKA